MKLQNLTIIFIIIILPIVLVLSAYIGYEIKTINKQNAYNNGLVTATHDAIFAFELNTKNDMYANNAENKRSNIKASIKTFENSLSTSCNLGLYNNQAIEEYIPAIVFGLYDGFYMYSPTQTQNQGFKHELRNYVYYSEEIKDESKKIDIVIRYTLDNYVAVSGTINGDYVTRAGYLVNLQDLDVKNIDGEIENIIVKYKKMNITYETTEEYTGPDTTDITHIEKDYADILYYKNAYEFTNWFLNTAKLGSIKDSNNIQYLNIGDSNDPEDENSAFVQHKRGIMKEKIEGVLNSSITAYANKTRNNYKMPKFSGEDWDKIYNNISVITFVQGMNIGFKNYNNYCILNSTNNGEYVNPNLMYFTDGDNYHDIRCEDIKEKQTTGYKIGSFEKIKYETTDEQRTKTNYFYKHNELACYKCINGNVSNTTDIYNYLKNSKNNEVKISYFSALARERQKTTKLFNSYNAEYTQKCTIKYDVGKIGKDNGITAPSEQIVNIGEGIPTAKLSEEELNMIEGFSFVGWKISGQSTSIIQPGEYCYPYSDITLYAAWEKIPHIILNYNYDNLYDTIKLTYGADYNLSSTILTRQGYEFKGWYNNPAGTGDKVTQITNIQSDLNLYAKWEKIPHIILNYNYDNLYESIELTYGADYNLSSKILTRQGYEFKGWYDNPAGTGDKVTQITNIQSDINLYAKWGINKYHIYLNHNYDNSFDSIELTYGASYDLSSRTLTRQGYEFKGWYSNSNGTGEQVTKVSNIESDVHLYAKWEEKKILLKYFVDNNNIKEETIPVLNCLPDYKILENQEGYEDKILLGYKVNTTGRVSYGNNINVADTTKEIRLDAIYVDSNDIEMTVTDTSDKNMVEMGEGKQLINYFWTNTTKRIKVKLAPSNNNGSPTIVNPRVEAQNSKTVVGNTYTFYTTIEEKIVIDAGLKLTKDRVNRVLDKHFEIHIDRTPPTIERVAFANEGLLIKKLHIYAFIKDNEGGSGLNILLPATCKYYKKGGWLTNDDWTTVGMGFTIKELNGEKYNYVKEIGDRVDGTEIFVTAYDMAGNKTEIKVTK